MNKKVSLLIISLVLTTIVFGISTYMQKKLVNYIPTMKCIILNKDLEAYTQITKEDIEYVDMPISIISSTRIVQNITDIEGLYLKDKIYDGQLLIRNQLDSKENLMIYQADVGKEKVSIKIKSAENGVSFTIRENSIVNVYATIRKEHATGILKDLPNISIGSEDDGYASIKILESVKILGTFNSDGEPIEDVSSSNIDTILVAVTPEEAGKINLIRDLAVFNITELGTLQEQNKL